MRDGIRAGIPFAIAAFILAVSFGVIAEPVIGAVIAASGAALLGLRGGGPSDGDRAYPWRWASPQPLELFSNQVGLSDRTRPPITHGSPSRA